MTATIISRQIFFGTLISSAAHFIGNEAAHK